MDDQNEELLAPQSTFCSITAAQRIQLGSVAGHNHEEENESYSEMLYTTHEMGRSFVELSLISSGQH